MNSTTGASIWWLLRPRGPHALYRGEKLLFEFRRAASRLAEMQSPAYLAGGHRLGLTDPAAPGPKPWHNSQMKTVAEFKIQYRQILDPDGKLVRERPQFAAIPGNSSRCTG